VGENPGMISGQKIYSKRRQKKVSDKRGDGVQGGQGGGQQGAGAGKKNGRSITYWVRGVGKSSGGKPSNLEALEKNSWPSRLYRSEGVSRTGKTSRCGKNSRPRITGKNKGCTSERVRRVQNYCSKTNTRGCGRVTAETSLEKKFGCREGGKAPGRKDE